MPPISHPTVSPTTVPDDLAQFEASYDPANPAETFQHYQVLRRPDGSLWELGRGAMGVTYKAFDTNLRCYVALKVISGQHLHSEVAGQRFIREARVAAQLRHRNIASVYHLGVDPQGFFYSMEFIDGETLEDLLERTGPLPLEVVLHIGLQTARALAVASRQGLIHRDIKPANLMVLHQDEDGEDRLLVKVIDFGLARSYDPDSSNAQLTATGFVGTPLYASPEQLEEKDLDIRSDIYSLGITLWILLTGRPPFEGKMTQVITQHLSGEPPWWQLGECPEPARALLERMLKKNPDERFQSAVDLRRAIEDCLRPWMNEASVSTGGMRAGAVAQPSETTTTRAQTEADSSNGFAISLRRALRRPSATSDRPAAPRTKPLVAASPKGSAWGLRPVLLAGTGLWRRLAPAQRIVVGGLALTLGVTGLFFRPSAPPKALPAVVPAKTDPLPSPAPVLATAQAAPVPPVPVQTEPVQASLAAPEPTTPPEAEPPWQPEVAATIQPPEPAPVAAPSFLLSRPDEAFELSAADVPAFEAATTLEMASEDAWPSPAEPLFAPEAPSNQDGGPLGALVASAAVQWADAMADDNSEEADEAEASNPQSQVKNRSKAVARRTRPRRSAKQTSAPQPNFFQKLFGIKPKPKPKTKAK